MFLREKIEQSYNCCADNHTNYSTFCNSHNKIVVKKFDLILKYELARKMAKNMFESVVSLRVTKG